MNEWLEKMRRKWQRQKLRIGQGATPQAIARFEEEHRVVLPTGFREYLGTLNGLDNDCF